MCAVTCTGVGQGPREAVEPLITLKEERWEAILAQVGNSSSISGSRTALSSCSGKSFGVSLEGIPFKSLHP